MNYPSGTHSPGTGPQPGPFIGVSPPPPWQPPPPARNRIGWIVAVVAITALLSAALGAVLGATLNSKTNASTTPNDAEDASSATAADRHSEDIALCTKYAIVNASLPNRASTGLQLLTAAAVLENAMEANPGATSEIRSALTAVVDNYYESAAKSGNVRTRGLAEPPSYDLDQAGAVYARAWEVCGLDE